MKTVSPEEFKKMYGEVGVSQLPSKQQKASYGSRVKDAFKAGLEKIGAGIKEAGPLSGGGLTGLVKGTGKQLGGLAEAVASPIAPLMEDTVGKGINYAADKISDSPAIQKFAQSPAGEKTSSVVETVSDYNAGLGLAAGIATGPKLGSSLTKTTQSATKGTTGAVSRAASSVKDLSKDIIPTRPRIINELVSKSFDLAPGDIDKISRATGNEVGTWVAENNLIRKNRPETEAAIDNFYKKNYDEVRAEIGKVQRTYQQYDLPRFVDALKQIKGKLQGVPGKEKELAEVSNLLIKQDLKLADMQRAKELLDEHFSLYKVTGDVGEGIAKEGLANIRNEIKSFIEKEVAANTGADIRALNNNVMTARALGEAIKTRTPKGVLRSNLRFSDATILFGFPALGAPAVVGLSLLFLKKLAESPTIMLRVAKYLDGLDDAAKAKMRSQMEQGIIPEEMAPFIKQKNLVGPRTSGTPQTEATQTQQP